MKRLLLFLTLFATVADAIPLQQSNTWGLAHPSQYQRGTPSLLTAQGDGDNEVYVLQANVANGGLDVNCVAGCSGGGGGAVTQGTTPWVDNITQFGGSNVVTGTGVSGAGIPRVTVSSDSFPATVTTTPSITSGTFQDGSIAFGSLTTSYATVVTTGGVAKVVQLRNNTNAIVLVSLNGGSTTSYSLDPGDQASLDLADNGSSIPSTTALQAKYSGSAPTSGSIRINVTY